MAVTSYARSDALAVELWAKKLAYEAAKATPIAPLIGKGSDAIVVQKDELKKGAGDKITVGLRSQLTGAGVTSGAALEGNEESLSTYSDNFVINELAHAVRVKGERTIDQKRVRHNLRKEAKSALVDWYADRMSLAFFMQVCGYNGTTMSFEGNTIDTTNAVFYGFNAPTAPSTNRVLRAGAAANDQSLTSSNTFDLTHIDVAKNKAMTANPRVRPIRVGGEKVYVMYLHPDQVHDLRTNTTTGQWLDIQKASYQGSRAKNPIFDGSLGMYNGVVLREAEHVCPGVNSSTLATIATVRRAVLLGAQAAMIGFGGMSSTSKFSWVEESFDYERELGVSAQCLMGMSKCVFNSEDFGVIVVSTYATTPTMA